MSDLERPKHKGGRPRKPQGPKRFQQVNTHLEIETMAALDEEAIRQRIQSRSEAIRIAVHEWLRRAEKRRLRQAGGDHGRGSDE